MTDMAVALQNDDGYINELFIIKGAKNLEDAHKIMEKNDVEIDINDAPLYFTAENLSGINAPDVEVTEFK